MNELRLAVVLEPKEPKYLHDLAIGFATAGQVAEAEKTLKRCIELHPTYHNAFTDLGLLQIQTGQFSAAVENLSSSLALKDTRNARLGRALANTRRGETAAAIEDCDLMLAQNPNDDEACAHRAYAKVRCGDVEGAARDAERAIALGNENAGLAYMVLGCVALQRGDDNLATEFLTKPATLKPDWPLPFMLRALCRLRALSADECIADLDSAIKTAKAPKSLNVKLDGCGWQAYKFRGYMRLIARNDYQGAITDLNDAISLNDKDADCYVFRSWAFCGIGDWKSALSDADRATYMQPENDLATLLLLQILTGCPVSDYRDPRRAIQLAEPACARTDWQNAPYIEYLAAAHSEVGDFEQATSLQEKAIAQIGQTSSYEQRIRIWWSCKTDLNLTCSKEDAESILIHYKRREPFHSAHGTIAFEFNKSVVK